MNFKDFYGTKPEKKEKENILQQVPGLHTNTEELKIILNYFEHFVCSIAKSKDLTCHGTKFRNC